MPRFIEETCAAVTHSINSLSKIAKQLAIANKLKALEMKSAGRYSVTPEMIDDIMKDRD